MNTLLTLAFLGCLSTGATPPPYSGPAGPNLVEPAPGFFRTREIDGHWWLVDPAGRAFYIVGTDHIRYDGHGCEKLGYSPYARAVEAKYGSEDAWAKATVDRLAAWGFNTLGAHHSSSLRHRGLPHIEALGIGTVFAGRDALCKQTTWTGFPNVFSPDWPKHCDEFARRRCAALKDDPWLIGYFLDNELEWFGKIWMPYGLFHEAWQLPAEHTGKQAWIAFLKAELKTPQEFEADWGVRVEDFDQLAAHVAPNKPMTDRARATALRWVSHVGEHYFRYAAEAIRRHDPNHLVLGCRFAGPSPGAWAPAGRYCDVVSFNYYPDIDLQRGVPDWFLAKVEEIHREAARPLMITEWSFPALDTELPSTNGAGMRVDTQAERARAFEHFQGAMFGLPFMVGSNYFMYIDEPALGIRESFPENSNYGLVSNVDEPYALLTAAAARLNPRACEIHAQARSHTPVTDRWLVPWLKELPSAQQAVPAGPLTFTAGELTLTGPVAGRAWKLSMGDTPLGVFTPMLQQLTPDECWEQPPHAAITAIRAVDDGTVVDMEFSRPADAAPTAEKASDGSDCRPGAYRTAWRFWIPASATLAGASLKASPRTPTSGLGPQEKASSGGIARGPSSGTGATEPISGQATGSPASGESTGWVATQCLWVENTDRVPWTLGRVFHYLLPNIGGSTDHDEPLDMRVQRHHRLGAAWVDAGVGLGIGCWLPPEMNFYYNFTKDPDGSFHPDVHEDPFLMLRPGQRYELPDGRRAFVFAFRGTTREAFAEATRRIETQTHVAK